MRFENLEHEVRDRVETIRKSDREKTKKEATNAAKKEKRVEPFRELSSRNKNLVERSKSLVGLSSNIPFWEDSEYDRGKILRLPSLSSSVWAVMSKGELGEPYDGVVALLTVEAQSRFENANGHESTWPKRQSAVIDFYDASGWVIDLLTKRPDYYPSGQRQHVERVSTPYASDCGSPSGCCDEIIFGAKQSMYRLDDYPPVRALSNVLRKRSINKQLNEFEKGLVLVEQAVADPELNPVLASRMNAVNTEPAHLVA